MTPLKYICICISLFFYNNSTAQLGRFNAGLNLRLAVLPTIKTESGEITNDGYTQGDFILNTPLSLRYYGKSIVSFQYQLEYRKENYSYSYSNVHYSGSNTFSSTKYLINSFNILLKLNKPEESNTSISLGFKLYHSFSQEYSYKESYYSYTQPTHPGDSLYEYSSSKFKLLKNSFCISLSRETIIKGTSLSIYREVYVVIPWVAEQGSEIPVLFSEEFGFTLGLAYNFGTNKK